MYQPHSPLSVWKREDGMLLLLMMRFSVDGSEGEAARTPMARRKRQHSLVNSCSVEFGEFGVNGSEWMNELYSVWLYRRYRLKERLFSSLLWQQFGLINNN